MLFSGINIKNELIRHRNANPDILKQVNRILDDAAESDAAVLSRLKKSKSDNGIVFTPEDSQNVFSVEDIRQICIRFRLRFLESGHFRADYPYDAVAEIKAFEKKYNQKIKSFRIIAPAEAFELENINKDPLLFAQVNDGNYYLLHQWGHDMKWYRRIFAWPLQNFKTLLFSLFMAGFLFSFSLPDSVMHVLTFEGSMYLRIWLSIHIFIGLTGLTLWAGLSFDKSLSEMNWNSKYYNF